MLRKCNNVEEVIKCIREFYHSFDSSNYIPGIYKEGSFLSTKENYDGELYAKLILRPDEKDIKFRCAWQLLYYCGLRIGELKGITWKDIDFENRTVSINKQITQQSCRSKWTYSPPKTAKSNRVLPLTKVLLNDLETLKKSDSLVKR